MQLLLANYYNFTILQLHKSFKKISQKHKKQAIYVKKLNQHNILKLYGLLSFVFGNNNKTKQNKNPPKPHITKPHTSTADKPQNIEERRFNSVPSVITAVNLGMQQIFCYNRDE